MQLTIAREDFACARWIFASVFAGISLTLLGVTTGCTSTTFDVIEPPQFARQIAGDSDSVVELNPLAYRFRAVEDHLVIRIYNPQVQPISILGPDSYVVDPHGQSHALASQAIPPGAFVKMILPPLPPEQTPTGPYVSFQVSSGGVSMDNPLPRQGAGGGASNTWPWPGNGIVKMSFRYRRGNAEPFTHSFSIRRNKS
jgi:hypothetical protein